MKCKITGLIAAIAVIVLDCPAQCSDDNHYEFVVFTQQWPITVCNQWKSRSISNTCRLPSLSGIWTIHGLWPSRSHSDGPSFCNRSVPFDPSKLQKIQTKLDTFWPNIENNTPPYSFWKHEWDKHGTCAMNDLPSELDYFQMGLYLNNHYNIAAILNRSEIVPSDVRAYKVNDLIEAVRMHTLKMPSIHCVRDAAENRTYLEEIRICLDLKWMPADCEGGTNYNRPASNCGDDDVYYPTKVVASLPSITWPKIYMRPYELEFEKERTDLDEEMNIWLELYKLVTFLSWATY